MSLSKVTCELCPRHCKLAEGQSGFCFIRQNLQGQLTNISYGKVCALAIDPIEKKPLYHFYPGSKALSLGTLGCNMGCKFCQNWHISKSRQGSELGHELSPAKLIQLAKYYNCLSCAFTYNEPIIWYDYALDCARKCHEAGIKTIAVTAAYINPKYRHTFFESMDGVNIDLKSFNPDFYRRFCAADLNVIKDNIKYVRHQTKCHLELTTLLIPGLNDSPQEIEAAAKWIRDELGADLPWHLSGFHPAYKLTDPQPTPAQTLKRARAQALGLGLHHVYIGNVPDDEGQNTYCSKCHALLIERAYNSVIANNLDLDCCPKCHKRLAGIH
ncbi:AmmeMemoRadiSam system radical SAM enzyme [bacterium]|nr:AmmeMemoRadiSam system radical SAM enzyme [bacterium]